MADLGTLDGTSGGADADIDIASLLIVMGVSDRGTDDRYDCVISDFAGGANCGESIGVGIDIGRPILERRQSSRKSLLFGWELSGSGRALAT